MKQLFINGLFLDWDDIPANSYLRKIPALQGLEQLSFRKPITLFTGENGSGKSTLLEGIAVAMGFNPEGGTRNYRFSTHDTHSELWEAIRLEQGIYKPRGGYFLRAESFYNVATKEEEYSGGYRSAGYHLQSHGESFLSIAQDYLGSDGVFLFDEPEAALSPQRQLTLLLEIEECARQGGQFFIVTHSPILLGMPEAEILSFDDGEIHVCAYEDTSAYCVTKMFVNNREAVLRRLLEVE